MKDEIFAEVFPFEEPRSGQRQIIEAILHAFDLGKKHVVLQAPTGVGKSVIGKTIANYYNKSYILTSQKSLQSQYVNELELTPIYGRSNYKCNFDPSKNCAECVNTKKCPVPCAYIIARTEGYTTASHTVLNYAYFYNMIGKLTGKGEELQKPRDLLIFDECHNVENETINFSTLLLSISELSFHNIYDSRSFPQLAGEDIDKLHWLFNSFLPTLQEKEREISLQLESMDEEDSGYMSILLNLQFVQNTIEKISLIKSEIDINPLHIVVLQNKYSITFKPLFGKHLLQRVLNPYKRVLHMSATTSSKSQYCKNLGLSPDEVEFIKCGSPFPISNRPIYYVPVGSMKYSEKKHTLPKIAKTINKLLNKYPKVGGIIHTANYETATYLSKHISTDRLVTPKGKSRETTLNSFYSDNLNGDNKVLLSPSLMEGVDLKYDIGRFGVVCKLPFPNLADPWVKRRMKLDPTWYTEKTVLNLIQSTGRIVRASDDKGHNFILDTTFGWFYKTNQHLFPSWWKNSLIQK